MRSTLTMYSAGAWPDAFSAVPLPTQDASSKTTNNFQTTNKLKNFQNYGSILQTLSRQQAQLQPPRRMVCTRRTHGNSRHRRPGRGDAGQLHRKYNTIFLLYIIAYLTIQRINSFFILLTVDIEHFRPFSLHIAYVEATE